MMVRLVPHVIQYTDISLSYETSALYEILHYLASGSRKLLRVNASI